MKRTSLIILWLIAAQQIVSAQRLSDQMVRHIAANWLKEHSGKDYTPETSRYLKADSSLSLVQMADGWAIVNAVGTAYPVVAYSVQGHYDVASHRIALDARACVAGNEDISGFVGTYGRSPKKFVPRKTRSPRVAPLMATHWSQNAPYNGMLPTDPNTSELSIAGCGPTAAAQVLNYHKFPAKGYGANAYTPADNPEMGELSVNFAEQSYNYSTEADMQKLYYHLGVSVNAEYSSDATSSSMGSLCHALIKYFSYDASTCRMVERVDYTNESWLALITDNLDQSLPIIYSGSDPVDGGHCFVIDGYENEHFVSVNWGWGGNNDGFYSIYALAPGGQDYTMNNYMIIGIKPNNIPVFKPDLTLSAALAGGGPIVLGSSDAFVSAEDTIADTDTAFIKFAIANFGAADLETPVEIQLIVNGIDIYKGAYKTVKMRIGSTYPYTFILPVKLKAGDNTVTINLDPKNAADELDETNNSFSQKIYVKTGFKSADLHFVATSVMGDSLVISNLADLRETPDSLASNAPLYCSFAVQNTGNIDMKTPIEVNAYLDGVLFAETTATAPLINGTIAKFESLALPSLTAGSHQLKITIDPNGKFAEINETNNTIIRSFTPKQMLIIDKPNLCFVPQMQGCDTVVISQTPDVNRTQDTLPIGKTVMFTSHLANNGLLTAPLFKFRYTINRNNAYYTGGTMNYSAEVRANGVAKFPNIPLGNLIAGNYELKLIADVNNDVDEYYENDNERTVKFTVIASLPQAAQPTGATAPAQGSTASYTTAPIAGALTYKWTLVPASAGTVTSNGASVSVAWAPTFTGTASLTVQPFSDAVSGDVSSSLSISISNVPSPYISLQSSTATIASAANSSATIQVGSNTNWTAASDQTWLTLNPTGATTGDGSIVMTASANTATTARTATITVTATGAAAKTITVTQKPGTSTTLSLSATSVVLFSGEGNEKRIQVTSNNTWKAVADQTWLYITPITAVTGDGSFVISATSNSDLASRTATITVSADGVNPQTITVTQDGRPPFVLTLSTKAITLQSVCDYRSVVDVRSNTAWTPKADQAWVTITQSNTEGGNGTFYVSAQTNTSSITRTATITVTSLMTEAVPQTILITQLGEPEISLQTSTATLASVANSSATVQVGSNTSWTAASDQTWLTLSPTGATTGDGSIVMTASANTATTARTATITVTATGAAAKTITVNQQAADATVITVSASTATLASSANSSATVQVGSNTSWAAASDQDWLTLSTIGATTGDGSIVMVASANTATTARSATITVSATGAAAKTITVTQQAAVISGIHEAGNNISLYPNPAADELFIGTADRAHVQVFDTKGQVVLSAETAGNQPVNIQSLPMGTYTVKITGAEQSGTFVLRKE